MTDKLRRAIADRFRELLDQGVYRKEALGFVYMTNPSWKGLFWAGKADLKVRSGAQ
ncbi:MAG: hypothetical protein KGL39_52155 [Patescibacteria group bacterium]|nr:hypothetical protein [Patescibacteria group bacterium]